MYAVSPPESPHGRGCKTAHGVVFRVIRVAHLCDAGNKHLPRGAGRTDFHEHRAVLRRDRMDGSPRVTRRCPRAVVLRALRLCDGRAQLKLYGATLRVERCPRKLRQLLQKRDRGQSGIGASRRADIHANALCCRQNFAFGIRNIFTGDRHLPVKSGKEQHQRHAERRAKQSPGRRSMRRNRNGKPLFSASFTRACVRCLILCSFCSPSHTR